MTCEFPIFLLFTTMELVPVAWLQTDQGKQDDIHRRLAHEFCMETKQECARMAFILPDNTLMVNCNGDPLPRVRERKPDVNKKPTGGCPYWLCPS